MRSILKNFLPTLFSYSMFVLVGIIDGIFIGNLYGVEGQSALGLSMPIILIFTAFCFALTIGGNTYFGQAIGEENPKEANKIFFHMVVYGEIFLSIVVAILLLLYVPFVKDRIGNPIVLDYFRQYIYIILPASLLMYLSSFLGFNQRVFGNSKVLIYVSLISLLCNIFFNTLFTIVFDFSIRGVAFASFMSFAFQTIFLAYKVYKSNEDVSKLKYYKFDPRLFFKIILNGLSDGIYDLANSIVQILIISILSLFVYSLAPSYVYILNSILITQLIIFFSLSDSINPLISVEYGRRNFNKIKEYKNKVLFLSCALGILSYIIISFSKGYLLTIFGVGPENVIEYGYLMKYSSYYFLVVLVFGINQSIIAILTAMGYSKISLILGIIRNLVLIIICTLVMTYFFGEIGLWSSYFIAEIFSLIIIVSTVKILKIFKFE